MKHLGLITIIAAALALGLTISLPSSAEARWRDGPHHQERNWDRGRHWNGDQQAGYYHRRDGGRYYDQGRGAKWSGAERRNGHHRYNQASSWCPYR